MIDDAELARLVSRSEDLPAEVFSWGLLKWLCNERLSPGASQTLGICYLWPGHRNPVHYHPNCEELLYMIAGQGEHLLDDRLVRVQPGTTLRIPAGVEHNLRNTGWEPIVCLISFSSGDRQTVFLD